MLTNQIEIYIDPAKLHSYLPYSNDNEMPVLKISNDVKQDVITQKIDDTHGNIFKLSENLKSHTIIREWFHARCGTHSIEEIDCYGQLVRREEYCLNGTCTKYSRNPNGSFTQSTSSILFCPMMPEGAEYLNLYEGS